MHCINLCDCSTDVYLVTGWMWYTNLSFGVGRAMSLVCGFPSKSSMVLCGAIMVGLVVLLEQIASYVALSSTILVGFLFKVGLVIRPGAVIFKVVALDVDGLGDGVFLLGLGMSCGDLGFNDSLNFLSFSGS